MRNEQSQIRNEQSQINHIKQITTISTVDHKIKEFRNSINKSRELSREREKDKLKETRKSMSEDKFDRGNRNTNNYSNSNLSN
jgi:hypothetical protein